MAWVVRRPVLQRWVLVVMTWLRAVWTTGGIGATAGSTQWGGTADMVPGIQRRVSPAGLAVAPDRNLVSATGSDSEHTPFILPVSGHLDSIRQAFNER